MGDRATPPALRSGSHVEVARIADPASPQVTLPLGPSGVEDSGSPSAPLLPYVGIDGQPSGATMSVSGRLPPVPRARWWCSTTRRGQAAMC